MGAIDLAGLAWLRPLLERHFAEAESRLVSASRQGSSPAELLRCLWAIHHLGAGLRSIGLQHAAQLGLELERSLRQLLLEEVATERRNLILGGIMRGLQILPACLDVVEESGADSGRGLAPCINDLRRWRGATPHPPAVFFTCPLTATCGISQQPATDEDELRRSAGLLLAPWVQSARGMLAGGDPRSTARTLGRIAHKLQQLFRGHVQERFWLGVIGLSEGLAVGMFQPDEAIAHILKVGALLIKQAREHGSLPLANLDSDRYLQQILFYLAACPVRTLYMQHACDACGVDDESLVEFNRPPVHRDALCLVLKDIDTLLQQVIDELESGGGTPPEEALHALERRLLALDMPDHLQRLDRVRDAVGQDAMGQVELPASVGRDLVHLQQDIRRRLHWRGYPPIDAEAIEGQQLLLASCRRRLLLVMQQLDEGAGHASTPGADAVDIGGSADVDTQLGEIAAALGHAGRNREAGILLLARNWLGDRDAEAEAEEPHFKRIALAFACLEAYWEQYLADPRAADETRIDVALESLSHLPHGDECVAPDDVAADVDPAAADSPDTGPAVETVVSNEAEAEVPDLLRAVFAEECAEQLERLQALLPMWESTAARDDSLREMRRHFHTFKGNGHAVGAQRLAELGREAQDMLDRVLESAEPVDTSLAPVLRDLMAVLPGLVAGNDPSASARLPELVHRCRSVQRGEY